MLRVAKAMVLLGLLPISADAANVASATSGDWSQASTWVGGLLPQAGDDVRILPGHNVRYDLFSADVLNSILINGELRFAVDQNTQLSAGLIVLSASETFDLQFACSGPAHSPSAGPRPLLQVGQPAAPVDTNLTATIRLHYVQGADPSCAPGIISHGGRVDLHGSVVTPTWTKLASTAEAGATSIVLADTVNWSPGDRLIVVGTFKPGSRNINHSILNGDLQPETEERVVVSISPDGRTIELDQPLIYEHLGGVLESDLRGEVAKLSRNVVIESADPAGVRGHTMFHNESAGAISYTEFRHLGKAGELGRYPIHFHLLDDSMRGSYVTGASIWDSANRWLTIHGSEFLVVRDTLGYKSVGHGFFLENGAEVYNVFDHNLGVQAYVTDPIPGQSLAYDLNHGGCYWAANARNFIYRNTFAECDNDDSFILDYAPGDDPMPVLMLQPDGTRELTDLRTVSGGLIQGLEVHSSWGWGPWIRGARYPDDDPLNFRLTKVWNTHYSLDISGDNIVFDGVEVFNASYGFYNKFPGSHLIRNAYIYNVSPHGAFMTYLGGNGTGLYENIQVEKSRLVFRMTAKQEEGANGQPIELHARNVEVLTPTFRSVSGLVNTEWVGTEGANVRSDPLLMLVNHDAFGPDSDGVFLPQVQSETQEGVPPGLTFSDADGVMDANGILLEGRGDIKYAQTDLDWPVTSLQNPTDQLPPASVILSPQPDAMIPGDDGSLEVCGVSADQSALAYVMVNEVSATVASNGLDWCAQINGLTVGELFLTVQAADIAGNVEQYLHSISVMVLPPSDADEDGIVDSIETLTSDSDDDGTPDYLDLDSDNNNIPDQDEVGDPSFPLDSDGDGVFDFQDLDNDGDGVGDIVEIGGNPLAPLDLDDNGLPDYLDADVEAGGDVNTDGKLDVRDLLLLQQYLLKLVSLTPEQAAHADLSPVGGDGVLAAGDLIRLYGLILTY